MRIALANLPFAATPDASLELALNAIREAGAAGADAVPAGFLRQATRSSGLPGG